MCILQRLAWGRCFCCSSYHCWCDGSPRGCGATAGPQVLPAPTWFLLLDSRSPGSGACAALWCMVLVYPSPTISGLKAARDRCGFLVDFMIPIFLCGFQFFPVLPQFVTIFPSWLPALLTSGQTLDTETTSSHHHGKSHLCNEWLTL